MKIYLTVILSFVACEQVSADLAVFGRNASGDLVRVSRDSRPSLGDVGKSTHSIAALIDKIAIEGGVDPSLVAAIAAVESNGNPNAISPKGAAGLMQLMPATAKRYGVIDRFDPAQNIKGGVAYLRDLLDEFDGEPLLAIAAYNAGETAVRKYKGIPPYNETQNYVARISRLMGVAYEPK